MAEDNQVLSFPARPSGGRVEFVATPTAVAIGELFEACQSGPGLGLIVGAPGTGKTTALREYWSRAEGAWFTTLSPTSSSLSAGLYCICEAMGHQPMERSAHHLRDAIRDLACGPRAWPGEDHHGLLIIDEAQNATPHLLDEIRSIFDEGYIGVVLCGNAAFSDRFRGKLRAAHFAQIESRLDRRLELNEPDQRDITAIADHHAIAGKRSRDLLGRLARHVGGLRTVAKVIRLARDRAGATHTITLDHLETATTMLGLTP